MKPVKLTCCDSSNYSRIFTDTEGSDFKINLIHHKNDPPTVNRLYVQRDNFSVELIPSKGLSVRDVFLDNQPMFWNPPLESIADPESVRLNGPMLIDGELVDGMSWLKYFSAHIEMLGLLNWGMPADGMGLHGNASNIPVKTVSVQTSEKGLTVSGEFLIFDSDSVQPQDCQPIFKVEKSVTVLSSRPGIYLHDSITNLTGKTLTPQWGYHIQLHPQPGAEYFIPGKHVEERFGGPVPADYREWKPSAVESMREEKGFIYKGLITSKPFPESTGDGVTTLLEYTDGTGIAASFTPPPYLQSWFSSGGAKGENFMLPVAEPGKKPKKMLKTNWDGLGPEFGNTSLDRNGNTDPGIPISVIEPGQIKDIEILVEFISADKVTEVKTFIQSNCKN